MKFLTEIDKLLPEVIALFTQDELERLVTDGSLDALHVHVSYGLRIRHLLTTQSELVPLFGKNSLSALDELASWLLMFLYLYQKSRTK